MKTLWKKIKRREFSTLVFLLGVFFSSLFTMPWLTESLSRAELTDTQWNLSQNSLVTDLWILYRVIEAHGTRRWVLVTWNTAPDEPKDHLTGIWSFPQLSQPPQLVSMIRWASQRNEFVTPSDFDPSESSDVRQSGQYWPWSIIRAIPWTIVPGLPHTYGKWRIHYSTQVPDASGFGKSKYWYIRAEKGDTPETLWEFWIDSSPPHAVRFARNNHWSLWVSEQQWTNVTLRPNELVLSLP